MKFTTDNRWIMHTLIFLTATFAVSAEAVDEKDFVFQIVPYPRCNTIEVSTGICLGMVASETDYVRNLQLSTGLSWAKRSEGLQFSGVLNRTGDLEGVQICCFNYASKVNGSQISGVLNLAGELKGTQIGIFNSALSGDGVQIGIFNFADGEDIRSFGLFNFHKNAWVNLQAGADTGGGTFLTLQSGLGGYYCSLSAGYFLKEECLSSSFAVGYRWDGKSLYLEGEGKYTQKYTSIQKQRNSVGTVLRAGIKMGDLFSFFLGGGLTGTADESLGFSTFIEGLYIRPELSLGIATSLIQ